MPRIAEEELSRIKSQTDLAGLVRAAGVELFGDGDNLLGKCPFHDDRTPSLVVSPSKNLWNCLGECKTGGSVIDWVMKREGVGFRRAVEMLREGVESGRLKKGNGGDGPVTLAVTRLPVAEEEHEDRAALLHHATEYYHETFKRESAAADYLARRGLSNAEAVHVFKIGYANRTLAFRVGGHNAPLRKALGEVGIFRKTGHEHFSGSLVIPIVDECGVVKEMYGRKIRDDLRKGTPMHLYLPGPHEGVWNPQAFISSRDIIFTEALLDALTFWCAGFRNVTACYGTGGFTDDHEAYLKRYETERVYIAFDADKAGDTAAASLAEKLSEMGVAAYRVRFPKGMDANEYALKVGPAERSLGVLVNSAELMRAPKHRVVQVAAPFRALAAPQPTDSPESAPVTEAPTATSQARLGAAEPPTVALEVSAEGDQVAAMFAAREYRVRGLKRNLALDTLRVSLRVRKGEKYHMDTLDLVSARQRASFIEAAASELDEPAEVVKSDVGRLLAALEDQQEKNLLAATEVQPTGVKLTHEEEAEALGLLRDPRLLDRILEDFERVGIVGEETNKLIGYLAAVSRKLDEPLAVLVQSCSAAGKTSLMDAVLAFVPEEEKVKYTAVTGQSLFYLGEEDLVHKVLAISEEEGAEKATYALKTLQSEKGLTIASTGKDPETGRMRTQEYRVEGPVAVILTTTAGEVDEELANRFLILTVNEDREQTEAVHRAQREGETLGGILRKRDGERTKRTHQNAQRLLRPLLVANPHANTLTFPSNRLRTRRDHKKYLGLIRAVALLRQYQKPVQAVEHKGAMVEFIEADRDDIETANRLAAEVLGRSLDELAPQARRLLCQLHEMVSALAKADDVKREAVRFTRRDVREKTGLSDRQVRRHLTQLEDLEYVAAYATRGNGRTAFYELLWSGEGARGGPFLMGLGGGNGSNPVEDAEIRRPSAPLSGVSAPEKEASAPGPPPDCPPSAPYLPPSTFAPDTALTRQVRTNRGTEAKNAQGGNGGAVVSAPGRTSLNLAANSLAAPAAKGSRTLKLES